jgi:hypothetical protein
MHRTAQFLLLVFLFWPGTRSTAGQTAGTSSPSPTTQAQVAVNEWADGFDGGALDLTKWERFTFEGGGGGRLEVKDGQLRMRGVGGSRSGVRSKQTFISDRFVINAILAKVGNAMPEPGSSALPLGYAILTVLFDSSGRNRIEWVLTSEGTFEAWSMVDGRGERLDSRRLGTKEKAPTLSIARKGDVFYFALNGQVGLEKSISGLPRSFQVMLYGFGSSENNWDSIQVQTMK